MFHVGKKQSHCLHTFSESDVAFSYFPLILFLQTNLKEKVRKHQISALQISIHTLKVRLRK